MNKKIIGYLSFFIIFSVFILSFVSVPVKADYFLAQSSPVNGNRALNNQFFELSQTFNVTTDGFLSTVIIEVYKSTDNPIGTLSCKITDINSGDWTNGRAGSTVIATATNVYDVTYAPSSPQTQISFNFVPFEVHAGDKYCIDITLNNGNTNYIYIWGSAQSYGGTLATQWNAPPNTWDINANREDIWFIVVGENAQPTPTPVIPNGTVGINFKVNYNGTPTQNYNSYGNLTWTILQGIDLAYYVGNAGAKIYFNDGLNIALLPQLANGWYFWNYTLITDTGYSVTYPINNWAITLNSSKGSTWNITLGISQSSNTIDLKLVDVAHGSIYFQNYVDSVPSGTMYGAGTYNVSFGTTLYISTLPDSGYKTDYYTIYANGITSKVTGTSLTFVATSNTTITPHYYISSTTDVTDTSGFWNFLYSFTWQNILALIIYAICVGICTYLFAFTGLIAGLDIATAICLITGLLGTLMYPILGLIIVSNIALIVLGSGLLNRRKNGNDA